MNPNTTLEIIQNNPRPDWSYSLLTRNPSTTWDVIYRNKHIKWRISNIPRNKFNKIPKWDCGKGWHFVPETKKFPYRAEVMCLHQIIVEWNRSSVDKYIFNGIFHIIIEFILTK